MRSSQFFIVSALLLLTLGFCCGCNVLGYAANGLAGDPKIPAAFTPAKKPMLVIAEKFDNPSETALDAEPIARYTSDELIAHEVAPIVGPEKVWELQDTNPAKFHIMTIAAVGRALGAQQILYMNIVSASVNLAESSDMIRAQGEVHVRLIDANTGGTIWPLDVAEGFPIAAETRIYRRADRNELQLRSDLHRILAARAARLFYAASKGE